MNNSIYIYIFMYLYYKDINMEVLLLSLLLAMGGIVLGNFISLMFVRYTESGKGNCKKTEGGICINQNFQRSQLSEFRIHPGGYGGRHDFL